MDAYMYQAELYCPECADKIKERLDAEGARPNDPADESSFDSDDYPKGPYADGGGESDSPENCAGCHIWLENPLTDDGVEHVLEMAEHEISRGPEAYNRIMPAKGTREAADDFSRWHGLPHKAIVLEWLQDLTGYALTGEQRKRLARVLAVLREGRSESVSASAKKIVDRLLEGSDDERRTQILKYVDLRAQWPKDATPEERKELIDTGFAYEETQEEGKIVYLTSLGELEVGYPETDDRGDVDESVSVDPQNLDGMPVEDLAELVEKLRYDHEVPGAYRRYAHQKLQAMRARAAGNIPEAQAHEHNCELLYAEIPEGWRW
jgi:hypothetical protein